MHAHIRPKVFEVRIYDNPDGYDKKEPYKAACLATQTLNDGEYEISMMVGEFGHKEMTAVLQQAKEYGATKLWFTRHGKLRSLVVA